MKMYILFLTKWAFVHFSFDIYNIGVSFTETESMFL